MTISLKQWVNIFIFLKQHSNYNDTDKRKKKEMKEKKTKKKTIVEDKEEK